MTIMVSRADAAIARGNGGVKAPTDRPSQRRSGSEPGSGQARVQTRAKMVLREAGDEPGKVGFSGYASVVDASYEMYDFFGPYTEKVAPGAFDKTLAMDGLDVPLVLQHQDLRRIARTTNGSLTLTADEHGLLCEAPDLDMLDHDVAYIVPKLRSGLVDEMSFKFMITKGSWSPDWMEYHIEEVDIHRGDVAICGYGANPHTAGAGLRGKSLHDQVRDLGEESQRELYADLHKRFGAAPVPHSIITDDDVRIRSRR